MKTNNHTPYPLTSTAARGLIGDVQVPGDKSISHRSLMLASQVRGTTTIHGLLEGEDVLSTAAALRQLGVDIEKNDGSWLVRGVGVGGLKASLDVLDMGNSGTSTRLLMGLVTPYPFTSFFTGDDSLKSRPMKRVITPLSAMGVRFTARDDNYLPLALTGTSSPSPIHYRLPVASAQVKSAILLAALNTPGTTTVIEPEATRDHTENMLRGLGFAIETTKGDGGETIITLAGKQQPAEANRTIDVPGDPSSAAFVVVAALICPDSKVVVRGVCMNKLRTGLFTTLLEMGAKMTIQNERVIAGEAVADLVVESSRLKAAIVPAARAPSMIDEYPILAVAAAFAEGESVMHGLAELKVKESDRLAAIIESLSACGVAARSEGDSLFVRGGSVRGGATIRTRYDHRIAMSFLVLGMASEQPVEVDDASAIATSFPNFTQLMNGLGARISTSQKQAATQQKPFVIAIDGPAASGKGTLARRLAEHYGLDYLDTGSLYRAVGMKLVYGGKDPQDREAAMHAAETIDADDLANPRLRQERIGQAASIVSAYPEVRGALLEFQRNFARGRKGAVLDGRDIGTVVYPQADVKFFITATLYARAKRRHRELSGEGIEVVFDSVLEDLRERDERDSKRAIAPLKPADDAIVMDTSDMDASTVFAKACDMIDRKK
ncbi:MAG: 3-phosphoshikimate 1-carboxyvinyltransferase [Alphaproteobacteria bacterium]|nr:3-phosphoshikimate 1-carboxyvinyltransferase [Alphaproteobacteria bacterium]